MNGGFNFKDWQPWRRDQKDPAQKAPNEPKVENPQPGANQKPRQFVEEIRVSGQNLVSEVERILREGEVSRLRIKQNNRVLFDLPIVFAAAGALIAPPLAAVGAIAALVSDCTIEIVRDAPPATPAATASTARPKTATSGEAKIPETPDDLSYR